jgi:CRP-like cAMP-binding protein
MLSIVHSTEQNYLPSKPLSAIDKRLYFHRRGDEIPLFAEGWWQIDRGLVQLTANYDDGEQVIFGWASDGHWFGYRGSEIIDYQALAFSDVYLRWWRLEEIENSPRLSQTLFPQLSQRMRQSELLVIINGRRRADERLRGLLSLLKQEFGEAYIEGKTRLHYKFTHQQLASSIATTRVTVSRMMGDLQDRGYVNFDRRRHLLLDNAYFSTI